MSFILNSVVFVLTIQDESEKYPLKIQKLFAPRLPFLYKPPIGFSPEQRCTPKITSLAPWKLEIEKYKRDFHKPLEDVVKRKSSRKQLHVESLLRQLAEWEDTDAFAQNEFLKDPYRTVFVSRLYYWFTELDLTKHFNRFGSIESVRVVRDKNGHSRGYGFVVFDQENDASNCIRELAPTGLAVDPIQGEKPRKILVDMERGRRVRNWKPRRLGGGLGGRHYTSPTAHHSRDASAASSGRRLNLSQNPYQQVTGYGKRPYDDRSLGPSKKPAYDYYSNRNSDPVPATPNPPISSAAMSYTPVASTGSSARNALEQSIKDKYAKYQSANDRLGGRSIRSIRQRD